MNSETILIMLVCISYASYIVIKIVESILEYRKNKKIKDDNHV